MQTEVKKDVSSQEMGQRQIISTKTPPQKFSNQNGKPASIHRKSPLLFSSGLFELAKEPHLRAGRATVGVQL